MKDNLQNYAYHGYLAANEQRHRKLIFHFNYSRIRNLMPISILLI